MSNKDNFSNVDMQKFFATSLYRYEMDMRRHDREYAKKRRLTAIIFCVSILLNIGLIIWLFGLFNWWIALLVGLVIFIIIILLSIWNIFSPSFEDLFCADMVRRTINEMSAKEKSDKEPMNTNEDGKTDNDTNKLNGDDWVRLLKVFPQFAQYCNWEKLSRKKGAFIYVDQCLMLHRIYRESTTSQCIQNQSRNEEDYNIFCRFWPTPVARLLTKLYKYGEKNNEDS